MNLIQSVATMDTTWRQHRVIPLFITLGLALVLLIAFSAGILLRSSMADGTAAAQPIRDTSYDRIEAIRGAGLWTDATPERSYDEVEALRSRLVLPATAPDGSYDAVERIRAAGASH